MAQRSFIPALRHEAALSDTFMKGRTLMLNGSVKGLEDGDSRFSRVVTVDGSVRGSRGDMYRTHVELDLDEREVIDYSCDCPAAIRYPGMCKHAIATALAYIDRAGIERVEGLRAPVRTSTVPAGAAAGRAGASAPARPASAPGDERPPVARSFSAPRPAAVNPNFPFPAPVPSSSNLLAALDDLSRQRRQEVESYRHSLMATADVDVATASFEPTLAPYYSPLFSTRFSWCLELRIRSGSVSYVVKDIDGLLDAWERHGAFSYGKKLTFVHVVDAFDGRSRELLDLMADILRYLHDITASRSASRDFAHAGFVAERQLPLSEHDIVRLLDIYRGGSVSFEPAWARDVPGRRAWEVEVENGGTADADGPDAAVPLLPAKIVASTGKSFDLRLPAETYCFAADDAAYLVDTRTARRAGAAFAHEAAPLLARLLPCRTPVHIAEADAPEFCRVALPVLRAYTDLAAPAGLDAIAPEATFDIRIGTDDGLVTCDVTVHYGDWSGNLFKLGAPGTEFASTDPSVPPRDEVAEFRVMDTVGCYFEFFERGPAFDEHDDERLYDLLTAGLAALSKLGEVMLSDRLRQISVKPAPRLSVRATVKSNLLDVELGASGLKREDLEVYLDSYRRHQKFARLTTGDIIRLDESARAATELAEDLGVDAFDLIDGVSLPASSTLFVDAMLDGAAVLEVARDAAFRRAASRLDSLGKENFTVPATLAATLRGYQVDGFQWLESLEHLGLGGILADDMGLGKTLQVITHVLARVEAGDTEPTLVVCPASLVYNWMVEIGRFAPSLDAVAIVGSKAQRRVAIAGAGEHQVLVTSYDLMRRDIDEYTEQSFARVVLDEAQYIKNPLTKVAHAAKRLPARVRFALTGTPIENRLSELWSIFDFLMPGLLGTHESFTKRFESPAEHAEGDSARRLQALISPFVLRRVKEDVVADLPEKIENTVFAHLEGEQRKLYLANQDRIAEQVQHRQPKEFKQEKLKILAELTKLRQICCDPRLHYDGYAGGSAKLDTCMELVRNAIDGGHRILLFSQFTGMLDIIAARLGKERVDYLKLVGATSKERRAQMVETFQAGDVPVFLISLKAGGVGLNLTAADVVIHYDPWWNVAAQDQATDRAHRIGQKNTVTVFKLICRDTIEERIQAMQESKRDLVKSVLDGGSISSALFTREDVLALLSGEGRGSV